MVFPKDSAQFSWTRHIKNKMMYYHLSGAQILRIFRRPERREEGIAPHTIAAMITKKSVGANKPRSEEIWLMYKLGGSKSRIGMISAWRYPGRTKPGERPQIPEDVLKILNRLT